MKRVFEKICVASECALDKEYIRINWFFVVKTLERSLTVDQITHPRITIAKGTKRKTFSVSVNKSKLLALSLRFRMNGEKRFVLLLCCRHKEN
jgi:hypothetical protein